MSQYYICRYTPPVVVQSPMRANSYSNYSYLIPILFHFLKIIIPIVIICYDFIPKMQILTALSTTESVLRIIKFVLLYEKQ